MIPTSTTQMIIYLLIGTIIPAVLAKFGFQIPIIHPQFPVTTPGVSSAPASPVSVIDALLHKAVDGVLGVTQASATPSAPASSDSQKLDLLKQLLAVITQSQMASATPPASTTVGTTTTTEVIKS